MQLHAHSTLNVDRFCKTVTQEKCFWIRFFLLSLFLSLSLLSSVRWEMWQRTRLKNDDIYSDSWPGNGLFSAQNTAHHFNRVNLFTLKMCMCERGTKWQHKRCQIGAIKVETIPFFKLSIFSDIGIVGDQILTHWLLYICISIKKKWNILSSHHTQRKIELVLVTFE